MTLKEHLINVVAAAAVLATGTAVASDQAELARHDERIKRVEHLDQSITGLRTDLSRVDVKLERLDQKLSDADGR